MKILIIGNILNAKNKEDILILIDIIKRLDQIKIYEVETVWPYHKNAKEYFTALRKAHLAILIEPKEYNTVNYHLAYNNLNVRFFIPERNKPIFNKLENYEKFILEIIPNLNPLQTMASATPS